MGCGRAGITLPERLGREAGPSVAVFDSQSLKSAEKGERRRRGL